MNEYINSILWFLSAPLLIFVSYRLVLVAIKRFEKAEKDKLENK